MVGNTTDEDVVDILTTAPLAGALRIFLTFYYSLILVLCWFGNSFTLYASVKHKAIKLDRLSVWIIQNLCIADILHGLVHVLPVVVSLSSSLDLHEICKPLMIVKYLFIDANSFLINALVFNKLYRCRYPFRPPPSKSTRYLLTSLAFLSGCLYATVTVIKTINSPTARFNDNFFGCEPDEPLPAKYETFDLIMTCVVLVVPVTTLVIANTVLLMTALGKGMNPPAYSKSDVDIRLGGIDRRRSILKAQINKRSFLIIGTTTIVYTIAQLPYLYFCFEIYQITKTLYGMTRVHFTRFSFIIMQSSCFVNPFIYFLTNRSFRGFALGAICGCLHQAVTRKNEGAPVSPHRDQRLISISRSVYPVDGSRSKIYCNMPVTRQNLTVPYDLGSCLRKDQIKEAKERGDKGKRRYSNPEIMITIPDRSY